MRLLTAALAFAATGAYASHNIYLLNKCSFAVGQTVSNYPGGGGYDGAKQISIPANGGKKTITVANGWNGRICDKPPGSGCENDCWGGIAFGKKACSMTEFKMNGANGLNYYDISNIQGYSIAQKIEATTGSCASVTCKSQNCACNQAYRPGDTSGTCGGTGKLDQAVRACSAVNYSVTFCP
jgi:hypothetical protein